jgi:hypothetical protein
MADESRYVATASALVATQTAEHVGWVFYPLWQDEWLGQVIEISFSAVDVAQRAQLIEWAAFRRRREYRHSAPPVRHFDCFALFDPPEELAGALSECPDTD